MTRERKRYIPDAMAAARQAVKAMLNEEGFRGRGNLYFRDCDDEIRQFIVFFPAPGSSTRAGQFSVRAEVFVPSISKVMLGRRPAAASPAHCQVRVDLGELRLPFEECWWPRHPASEEVVVADIEQRVRREALGLLARLGSHEQILASWRELEWEPWVTADQFARRDELVRCGDFRGAQEFMRQTFAALGDRDGFAGIITWYPAASVAAAILMAHRGDRAASLQLLEARKRTTHNVAHARFLAQLAETIEAGRI